MSTQGQINANLTALGFDNASMVGLGNKIAEAIGLVIDNTLTEIGNSETRITAAITSKNYGKASYYEAAAKAFQMGDDLLIDTDTQDYYYAVVDATKQIIAQASFKSITSGNQATLYLKIAAVDSVTGNLIPLTVPQLAAFTNYFVNYELPGLPVNIISAAGNLLRYTANATYYATYDFSTLQTNLQNALTTFRQTFSFNGEFFAGDLQDYIKQNVPGIRDFYVYNTTIDGVPFAGSQDLTSGYFNYADGNIINYTAI